MPLLPSVQSVSYNYINNILENYFCCQVTATITKTVPLRNIYVIILWTMALSKQYSTRFLFLTPKIRLHHFHFLVWASSIVHSGWWFCEFLDSIVWELPGLGPYLGIFVRTSCRVRKKGSFGKGVFSEKSMF